MGHVIVIFGTLLVLNLGFGYWLSEQNAEQAKTGVVEVEEAQAVPDDSAAMPADKP